MEGQGDSPRNQGLRIEIKQKKGVSLFMTHPKHLFSVISKKLLLVDSEVDSYSDSNSSTYHRVVTHTEEAHHLNVGRN